jgi:DNA-binding transcriptional LysR family regulator
VSLSLRQLKYFVAVAEAGQVSGAARQLYVSQSVVTTAVQELERELEQPLFERSSRGVRLTETGMALLPKARQILQMVQDAATVTAGDSTLVGSVRVGVTYTVTGYFVPQHIHQLTTRYPKLQIDWEEMDRQTVEEKVVSGELDFGLALTSNLQNPGIRHETFVHSKRRLWMAPTHPLASRTEIRLADLAHHPYALLTVDEADLTTRSYWGALEPRVFLKTSSIEAIRSLVANGDAVTILSDMVYRPWSLEGRRIETAVLQDVVPDMCIGLAWSRGRTFSAAMSAFHGYFSRLFCTPALAK